MIPASQSLDEGAEAEPDASSAALTDLGMAEKEAQRADCVCV